MKLVLISLLFSFFLIQQYLFLKKQKKNVGLILINKSLILLKKELTPFKQGNNDDGPRLSNADLKQLEIKHYSEQLKDSREMRMDILSFSTLNQNDLEIFKKFTSKIKLVLSDCSEVVFFGDTLLGAYELPYEDMLKAFTLASKNNNDIILNFIKNQVTPNQLIYMMV